MTLYRYDRVASSPVGGIKLRQNIESVECPKIKQQTKYYLIFFPHIIEQPTKAVRRNKRISIRAFSMLPS